MSADNYIAVQKRWGRWYVWMESASNDYPYPNCSTHSFPFYTTAMDYALNWMYDEPIVEYGIHLLDPAPETHCDLLTPALLTGGLMLLLLPLLLIVKLLRLDNEK